MVPQDAQVHRTIGDRGCSVLGSQVSLEMPEEAAYSGHQSVKGGIRVFIRTQDGLQVQKKGLSYQGLVSLVGKLEGLC